MHECRHGATAFSHLSECYLGIKLAIQAGTVVGEDEAAFTGY